MPVAAIAIKARLKTRKVLSSPKATVIAMPSPGQVSQTVAHNREDRNSPRGQLLGCRRYRDPW
jgi:hypothetical protein